MECKECGTDIATIMTVEENAFLWECATCGWFSRIFRRRDAYQADKPTSPIAAAWARAWGRFL